jgi:hypothetical protein
MAYWHYPNGEPAPAFTGKFDWSHLFPIFVILGLCLLGYLIH